MSFGFFLLLDTENRNMYNEQKPFFFAEES